MWLSLSIYLINSEETSEVDFLRSGKIPQHQEILINSSHIYITLHLCAFFYLSFFALEEKVEECEIEENHTLICTHFTVFFSYLLALFFLFFKYLNHMAKYRNTCPTLRDGLIVCARKMLKEENSFSRKRICAERHSSHF